MSVPYMGSKRKSAGKIYQTIKNLNPKASQLIELFCGGFAVGEYFIKNGWKVIANDKNKYVIALLDQTINEGLNEQKCLEFVNREKFFDVMKNPDKYEDWYVGYVQCIWSFGNNQTSYLFGKNTEPSKKAGHELVVNCNPELINKLGLNIPEKYIDGIIKQTDCHLRRMALRKVTKVLQTRIFELQQLQQLQQLERLQQLEQLERLQQLQQLEPTIFTSLSYDEVIIPNNAIIYCDPPYQGRREYKEGSFDHNKFWDWVREKSKTHKVYVSEYNAPDDFESVLEFEQKSTLQGGTQNHDNQPKEKVFRIKQ